MQPAEVLAVYRRLGQATVSRVFHALSRDLMATREYVTLTHIEQRTRELVAAGDLCVVGKEQPGQHPGRRAVLYSAAR